ncbi:putative toxin-antitoxin system toxin component, PIN family [Dyadobacter sp. NIV53]|uniref:putative toxin-antitoxin system toxin component, PIN family n=1 Tax=Dyadobacter sp. NIV53 TaxID=2861765 RepID=UPI0038D38729
MADRFLIRFRCIIVECRDPKDNMFLELAIVSKAACLISVDSDLLVLNPFQDVQILNVTNFLENF